VNWDKPFLRPIALSDGRRLVTLNDAANLIISFTGVRRDAALERALKLLMQSAESSKRKDVGAAAEQIQIVLRRRMMAD
jgi:hypothetical protein